MPSEREIQLLLADNHEMVRAGVKALLANTEIKVAVEASTGEAAARLALAKEVDVVLLDVQMPDGDGLMALDRIKLDKPKLPVLLFSAFDNPASIARAIALGANGSLLKDCSRDALIGGIRTVAGGENIWSKETLRSASRFLKAPRNAGSLETSFSESEGEVLRQVAMGLTNEQIAEAMKIDYDTVKVYVHQVLRKIGVVDRTQAALWAVRNDLV
jgi:DNA-binding NarL/FixJ family response regulator